MYGTYKGPRMSEFLSLKHALKDFSIDRNGSPGEAFLGSPEFEKSSLSLKPFGVY